MPGMTELDQPMKIQELGDTIYIAEAEKTPFGALLPRGDTPNQVLNEWPVQKYPDRGFGGTVDGTDIDSFNSTTRKKMEGYCMWLMTEGWLVTKLANLTKAAGVGRNEKAKQAKDDALILAQMQEKQMLSNLDLQTDDGVIPYRSRGAFSWLDPDAQALKPVPAGFRPGAASRYEDALTDYGPGDCVAQLQQASLEKKGPVDLTYFSGMLLKSQMSGWAQHSDDVGSKTAIENFNTDAATKRIMHVVDFFEFDAGKVKTILSWYLYCLEATGALSDFSQRSGVGLDLSMWEVDFMQQPMAWRDPPKSGGPRGWHDVVYILKCLNALGQISTLIDD